MKRLIVVGLEKVCGLFHWRWYTCRWFANWSDRLDQRWGTGVWSDARDWDISGTLVDDEWHLTCSCGWTSITNDGDASDEAVDVHLDEAHNSGVHSR